MKCKNDWADKAMLCVKMVGSPENYRSTLKAVSRALRAAEKRGFQRAVKLLREKSDYPGESIGWADWLEDREGK